MHHTIKNIMCVIATGMSMLCMTSCDDGLINEKEYEDETTGYTVVLTGTLQGLHTWYGDYGVALAGFNDESSYAIIQKSLPSEATDSTEVSMTLSNISTKTKTIEIAVMNSIRKRIATIYSYDIPEGQNIKDTIRINVDTLNVGMFGAINKCVFQGSKSACSRCHAASRPTAQLDLSEADAYANLVGTTAYKDSTYLRVKAGDAENSFLYKVITTGVPEIKYNHPGIFADDDLKAFQSIIKTWIDKGAKK